MLSVIVIVAVVQLLLPEQTDGNSAGAHVFWVMYLCRSLCLLQGSNPRKSMTRCWLRTQQMLVPTCSGHQITIAVVAALAAAAAVAVQFSTTPCSAAHARC